MPKHFASWQGRLKEAAERIKKAGKSAAAYDHPVKKDRANLSDKGESYKPIITVSPQLGVPVAVAVIIIVAIVVTPQTVS